MAASQVAEPQGWKVFPPSRETRPPPRLEPRTAPAGLVVPERKVVQELPGNSLVTKVGGANVSLASPLSRAVAKTATAGDHSATAQRSVTSMTGSATKATKLLGDPGCDNNAAALLTSCSTLEQP